MRGNHLRTSLGLLSFKANTIQWANDTILRKQNFHTIHEGRHTWSVLKHVYQKHLKTANKKYACFLLNISDDDSQAYFDNHKHIWDEADLKIAVDGSANFLAKRKLLHTADVISGDFDSIDNKLIQRLQSPRRAPPLHVKQQERTVSHNNSNNKSETQLLKTPQIVETPSQKETDFTKAIHVAIKLRPDVQHFFALYYTDGHRMDHLFGLINTLHLIKKDIFIINTKSSTISWLLQPGDHTILKPHGQELCSLVPFTGLTEVKTQGLLYNVNARWPMSFGGLISTSNFCQPARDRIIVDTKGELLWSLDLYESQD
uniref:Thiamine pyrophosphokinase 1 n=1 Tax=Aceria tosichella TaxID=561515 RepID=A0A6G1S9P8_9ACAR